MSSNIRTPNNHLFPFGTNGKVVVLGVPILKHFRVLSQRAVKPKTTYQPYLTKADILRGYTINGDPLFEVP